MLSPMSLHWRSYVPNETFSIMSAEAMACACPVVGSRFGGIPEVIADGKTGFLAEPENVADFALTLERLLELQRCANSLGHADASGCWICFTWDKVTERVFEAYRDIS